MAGYMMIASRWHESIDLAAQYDWLADNFLKARPRPFGRWATRPHLDPRRGVTVIGRFSTASSTPILELLRRLRTDLPDHLVYPDVSIHLTIVVPVQAGCHIAVKPDAYVPAVRSAVRSVPAFSLQMEGVSMAGTAVILRGFPLGDELSELRASVHSEFSSLGLPNLEDKVICYDGSRRPRCTAHVTLARLGFPDERLEEKLSAYSTLSCGKVQVSRIELVRHDEFLTPEKCRVLYSVQLLNPGFPESEA